MQDLLSHILEGILGEPVEIKEETSEGFTNFVVNVPKDKVGIVIGKGGKTINAIKNVLKIRAIRENVRVDIQVNEA
ncbi:MAG TPA: KH domain-containing protein [Patescibacteria group bacterium]|nr:KH domain-containing protein [Patescibacteria group bacterium]